MYDFITTVELKNEFIPYPESLREAWKADDHSICEEYEKPLKYFKFILEMLLRICMISCIYKNTYLLDSDKLLEE